MLVCMCIPVLTFAQSDSTRKKAQLLKKQPANSTKLEIVTNPVLMRTSSNSGISSTFYGLRVNDAKPIGIEEHGNMLKKYYSRAPLAMDQITLMNQQRRRGNYQLTIGLVGGGIYALSGIVAAANKDKAAPLLIRFGIGFGAMITAAVLKMNHSKRAEEHMLNSVFVYNSKYYKPLPVDSAKKTDSVKPEVVVKQTSIDDVKSYKDSVGAAIMRNAATDSRMAGFILDIANIDYNAINFNISSSVGFYYTYKSKIGVTGLYTMAFWNDITGGRESTVGNSWHAYGEPSDYKRMSNIDVRVKGAVISWTKERDYHLYLGHDRVATTYGKVKGEIVRALTVRGGYQLDNRVAGGDIGMPFATKTLDENGQPYSLSDTRAMMRSNIASVGIGFSAFRDMKIKLIDEDYKGRREEKGQSDVYLDFLYAHSIKFQDIIYNEPDGQGDSRSILMDVSATPVRKAGFRLGYQFMKSYTSWSGRRFSAELGITPGPKLQMQDQIFIRLKYGFIFGGRL